MKYLFINFVLFFFLSSSVFAKCTDSELKILNDAASKVNITYQYNEEYEKLAEPIYGNFSLFITGVTNDIYVYDYNSLTSYFLDSAVDGVITINDLGGGDRKIYIMSNINNCKSELVKTVTVNIPKFNYYAVSKYCEGIDGKEFAYCDKWYQLDFNKSTFLRELEIYKNKKPVIPGDNGNSTDIDNSKDDNWVKDFVKDYYVYIVLVVVVLIILVILFFARRKKGDIL